MAYWLGPVVLLNDIEMENLPKVSFNWTLLAHSFANCEYEWDENRSGSSQVHIIARTVSKITNTDLYLNKSLHLDVS